MLEQLILDGKTSKELVNLGFKSTAIKYARKRLIKSGKFTLKGRRFIAKSC